MIIRNTPNGNFTFGKGKSDYLTGLDAIKGNIIGRLNLWVGDCFYAPAEGVDYNAYLDKNTEDLLVSDLKRVIVQSEGVIRITIFEAKLDRELRDLKTVCEIETIYGKTFIISDEEGKTPAPEYVAVKQLLPDGSAQLLPSGAFQLIFVRKL